MFEKLQQMEQNYSLLQEKLNQPETYDDPQRAAHLNRELRELEEVVTAYREWEICCRNGAELEVLMRSDDPELRSLAGEEFYTERKRREELERQLRTLLLPKDPDDGKSVIIEVRAGVGGEEAALFAHSLCRMYGMYGMKRGWKQEQISVNATELGGVKEMIFTLDGAGAYARMKFESGVHRVQRVPETESGGRVHTSTVTVAVLPEVDDVEFELDRDDLRIDTFRSSGAGGQHINKTSSAIRITHLPTGMVVECQDQRSQLQNKEKALQVLRSRLYQQKVAEQQSEVAAQRRSQVGSGMRNERIRTYNFPQGRVTDHRIGLTLYRIDDVMNGELDEIIDALMAAEQAEKLQSMSET